MKLLFTLAALFVATSAGTIDCKNHPYNVSGDPASYSNRCYRGDPKVRECFFDQGILCDGQTSMQRHTRYKCTPRTKICEEIKSTKTQLNACLDRYCIISGQGSFVVASGPRRRALAGRRLMPYVKAVEFCCDGERKQACDQLADHLGEQRAGPNGWKAQQNELCKTAGVDCPSCIVTSVRKTVDAQAAPAQKTATGSNAVLVVFISLAVVFALAIGVWVGRRTSEMKIPQELEAEPISVETV